MPLAVNDINRINKLNAKREKEVEKYQALKDEKEKNASGTRLLSFGASSTEVVEHAFKKETVGLQTKAQFTEKRANIEKELEKERKLRERCAEEAELREKQSKRQKKKQKPTVSMLSFGGDDDEEGEFSPPIMKKRTDKFAAVGKNPNADTAFLPDRDRDREERSLREKLKEEWLQKQSLIMDEILEVSYSYWDGTGHRKKLKVRKGDTINTFLKGVKEQLAPDFREMRSASVENMLYIKEDLIIPGDFTFHWLIANKARGKSGPLFHFDIHEDLRLLNDASKEKDESHAGKVVERHWYDKNKHIFPASRWEIFDPNKDYGSYSIHGDKPKEAE